MLLAIKRWHYALHYHSLFSALANALEMHRSRACTVNLWSLKL